MRIRRSKLVALTVALASVTAACSSTTKAAPITTAKPAEATAATTAPAGDTTTSGAKPVAGAAIKIAVNPWTGSAVNANVAKVVLETKLATSVSLVELDENAAWVGLDDGSLDANLEVWPSGHAADYDKYVTSKKSVVDLGKLGPAAKIGWYVPSYVIEQYPSLATWEGFKDVKLAKLFASAESGDQGQFLMGDASYVTFDEQIIASLGLPLKYTVAGSEAALIAAVQKAVADKKPILLQFWQPHWLQNVIKLTEVKLPAITDACTASKAANAGKGDGKYACDYPVDNLYKVASAGLGAKNKAASDFLAKFSLTTAQQNEIAGMVDKDKKTPEAAAKEWVAAHGDVVDGWLK